MGRDGAGGGGGAGTQRVPPGEVERLARVSIAVDIGIEIDPGNLRRIDGESDSDTDGLLVGRAHSIRVYEYGWWRRGVVRYGAGSRDFICW